MAKKHKQTENKADKDTESQFSVSEACEDNLGTNENTEKEKIAVFTTVLGGSDASLRAVGLTGIKNSIVVFVSRSRQRFSRRRNNNASSKNIGAKDPKNKRKDNKPKKENSFFAKISKMLKKYSYFVFILIIIILLIWVFIHKNASQVYVDDKLVGTIKEKEITAEKIYNDALAKIQSEKGVNVKLNEEISLKPVHASKKEVVSADYILTEVCKNLTYQVEACSLVIDGKPIALIENEDTANKILDDFAKKYIAKDSQLVERSFVQNVKFEKKFVKNSEIETEDTILNKLSQSIDTPQQHIVGSGDSLFQIAVNADMSMDELIAANPGLNENSVLQPGQIINVVVPVPLLSVKTVEQIKYEENFDADVIVVDNNDEYKTYEKRSNY